ncbi:FIST N-terminal domain-containing protein [Glaciecola sp. MF2-115]|uniref:FIST N-terminal domain-containing protein n=1 Tax=Glaciecola sp. MF2-115 TaxID=3384827 RepID=UPI0039A21C80
MPVSKPSILTSSRRLVNDSPDLMINTQRAVQEAISDILAKTEVEQIELLIVHFSVAFDFDQILTCLNAEFSATQVIGCSSAGEFNMQGYQTQSIVFVALLKSDFVCSTHLLEQVDEVSFDSAYKIAADLRQNLREKASFESEQQMVISFLDGLSMNEEVFLHSFSPVFGNIPHFGGSAGDDLELNATYLLYNGRIVQKASIITLIGSRGPFKVFSVDHIETPVSRLVVTNADPSTRTVFELNGEPAAEYYAKLMGKDVKELSPKVFSKFPLAVLMGGKYFIRSIQKIDIITNSLTFYCAVDLGMILTAVQLGECSQTLQSKLEELRLELGEPEMIYGCDCFLRRLDIIQSGKEQDIKNMQQEFKIAGFNAYGEHMNSIHMNQTFTGVYFARASKLSN